MIDYTILYKSKLPALSSHWTEEWDLFLSGYSLDSRVQTVFDKVRAREKWWLVQPQYGFAADELPKGGMVFESVADDEGIYLPAFFAHMGEIDPQANLCIDISGLMRPHLLFMLRYLFAHGITRFDVLYSEPGQYLLGAETRFAEGRAMVREVTGFGGSPNPSTDNDLLIVGAGYDSDLIAHAAYAKEHARKLQMFGLPSLQPDMYQESRLRAKDAEEALGESAAERILVAPAHDPFVTATILSQTVARIDDQEPITNLYLCPVGSKPQVLGFGLFYVTELINESASLIYPFAEAYGKETTTGIKSVWKYSVEALVP